MADSKISDLTAITVLADTDELVIASAGASKKISGADLEKSLSGSYLASGSRAADVSTAGTTFAAGADVLAAALSFTADGTSTYIVEVFCAEWRSNSSGVNNIAKLNLDGADGGFMAVFTSPSANFGAPLRGEREITPSAGAHTVNVRIVVGGGTTTVFGASIAPIYVRVKKK